MTVVDGRVLRGQRNRERMVEALLRLYDRGVRLPSLSDVAEEAGLTTRSIYHHFEDMESLAHEVGRRQNERFAHLFDPPPVTGTLDQRATALVAQRAELFEAISSVRRTALLLMHRSPTIARQQKRVAAMLRDQVLRTFAPELDACDGELLLEALDLLTSWEAWDRLRTWQRLSADRARQVLVELVIDRLSAEEGKG